MKKTYCFQSITFNFIAIEIGSFCVHVVALVLKEKDACLLIRLRGQVILLYSGEFITKFYSFRVYRIMMHFHLHLIYKKIQRKQLSYLPFKYWHLCS